MIPRMRLLGVLGWIVCFVSLLFACSGQPSATGSVMETAGVEATRAGSATASLAVTAAPPASAMASPTPEGPTPSAAVTAVPKLDQRETRLTPVLPVFPERVPTSSAGVVTGEVPEDLLDKILADAGSRTGVDRQRFTLVRAEAVTWNDGSLGCPQPGMMYTQALVDGYWVVLQFDDKELDYRAAQTGFFVLCKHTLALPGGAAAPKPEQ